MIFKELLSKVPKTSGLISLLLIKLGIVAILLSLFIIIITFYPIAKNEISFDLQKPNPNKQVLIPVDEDFGIVIPKIRANSKVMANVDPFDVKDYQYSLTKGVAHARGSALPGQTGNVFIFSHSSVNFYEATRYNSIFYLLSKLEKGDEVYLFYKSKKFAYKIYDTKIINPEDIQYLKGTSNKKMLTLMTCWPPGTSFKRLIVLSELEGNLR